MSAFARQSSISRFADESSNSIDAGVSATHWVIFCDEVARAEEALGPTVGGDLTQRDFSNDGPGQSRLTNLIEHRTGEGVVLYAG